VYNSAECVCYFIPLHFYDKVSYVILIFKFVSQVLSAPLFLWCVVGFRCSYYIWRSAENK